MITFAIVQAPNNRNFLNFLIILNFLNTLNFPNFQNTPNTPTTPITPNSPNTLPPKKSLQLSGFHHSHHPFGQAVGAFGIIFLHQRGAEGPGKGLVEACLHRTEEGLNELIRR